MTDRIGGFEELTKTPAHVIASAQEPLLEPGPDQEADGLGPRRPGHLLPDPVFVGMPCGLQRRLDPRVTQPCRGVFGEGVTQAGANEKLVEPIGVIGVAGLQVEPPPEVLKIFVEPSQSSLSQHHEPEAFVVHGLGTHCVSRAEGGESEEKPAEQEPGWGHGTGELHY